MPRLERAPAGDGGGWRIGRRRLQSSGDAIGAGGSHAGRHEGPSDRALDREGASGPAAAPTP